MEKKEIKQYHIHAFNIYLFDVCLANLINVNSMVNSLKEFFLANGDQNANRIMHSIFLFHLFLPKLLQQQKKMMNVQKNLLNQTYKKKITKPKDLDLHNKFKEDETKKKQLNFI